MSPVMCSHGSRVQILINGVGETMMIIKRSTILPFAFLLFALAAAAVFSQSTAATLSGTVLDEKDAVVPGAAVTITNTATGARRNVTTDESGTFTIPLLQPGTYTLLFEREGFTRVQVPNVILNVNDRKTLKIELKVGALSAAIEVRPDESLISESPAVGTVIDRQFVANIPLNGRSFQSLIRLSPGVVITKTTGSNTGQFSINGQRANANYYTVDGVSANIGTSAALTLSQTAAGSQPGLSAFGGTSNLVSVDALQEFKILTSSYAPEFGRTPGGQISIATRSGTNDLHGSVFDYFRNDKLDATDWFANAQNLRKPPMRQNDFGGTIGGRLARDRTFYFFSYEGLRLRQPQVSIVDVPALSIRESAPAALQPYLNAFPIPNGAINTTTQTAKFASSYSNPATLDAASIRIDHNFSSTNTLFGRYNDAPSKTIVRAGGLNTVTTTKVKTRTLTFGLNSIFTSQLLNDLRINWSNTGNVSRSALDTFGGAVVPPNSSLFPAFASPNNSQFVFQIAIGTTPTLRAGPTAANANAQLNIVDSVSVTRGNHQLKFGGDLRRLYSTFGPAEYAQNPVFTSAAAINAGTAASVQVIADKGSKPRFFNFSAFVQDIWKASRRATLTYGVRWEVNPAPTEANGLTPFNVIGLDNPATASLAPQNTPLYKTTYTNFAPRFGIAYELFHRRGLETVIRGGLGMFYDLGNGQAAMGYTSAPFLANRALSNVAFPLSEANAASPPFTFGPTYGQIYAFDSNLKLPRTYQFNFAVEQALGSNQSLSLSYVGALGRKLLQIKSIRNFNTAFTRLDLTRNTAVSDYHALQAQFERRLSKGLQALASYTWSHSIDNSSDEILDLDLSRASSTFDIRHSFNAALTYNIPTPHGLGRFGEMIFGNWSVDSIVTARSAAPVNVIARFGITFDGLTQSVRPDLITGVPLYLSDPTAPGGRRTNPAAFTLAPMGPSPTFVPQRQGTLGRNALRGFPLSQIDFSIHRKVKLSEKTNLVARIDVFNVLNHPNFGDPGADVPSGDLLCLAVIGNGTCFLNSNFGRSRSMFGTSISRFGGGFNPLYQIGGPRSIQLSLKLHF